MYNFSGDCPVCKTRMEIVDFECPECSTHVRGNFPQGGALALSKDKIEFVKTFLRCRGNIKEVERELGISYPTVRNRLNEVIEELGLSPIEREDKRMERNQILERLESGEIDAAEAEKLLRK